MRRFHERTYQGFAGDDLHGNRFVMPSSGRGGGTEGAMYHHSFGRGMVPIGVTPHDVRAGKVFAVLEPGQVVNIECYNAGPAGAPVAPYSFVQSGVYQEDGRGSLVLFGDNGGETHRWAGFALEASSGEGDVIRVMFMPFWSVGAEDPPVEPVAI